MAVKKTSKAKEVKAPEPEAVDEVVDEAVEEVAEKPKKEAKPKEPELVTIEVCGQRVRGKLHGNRLVTPEGVTYAV